MREPVKIEIIVSILFFCSYFDTYFKKKSKIFLDIKHKIIYFFIQRLDESTEACNRGEDLSDGERIYLLWLKKEVEMKALGRHLLVELYDCDPNIINDVKALENIMTEAARIVKATIVDVAFHTFNPHGISGIIVIAESHLAIHTWPEYNYASVDIYTCGDTLDPWKACRYIFKKLGSKNMNAMELKRGVLNLPGKKLNHKPVKGEPVLV